MTSASEFPSSLCVTTASIANGATTSGAVDLGGTTLVGIQLPTAFTGTSLTFLVATSASGTYQTMTSLNGSTYTATVAQGKYLSLNPSDFAGVEFLKIVSGSTEGGARTVELLTRAI